MLATIPLLGVTTICPPGVGATDREWDRMESRLGLCRMRAAPLASALSHVQRSADLLKQKRPNAALLEAHEAMSLAPDDVRTQEALGNALKALGRNEEARTAYKHALTVIATMEPDARKTWEARIKNNIPLDPRILNSDLRRFKWLLKFFNGGKEQREDCTVVNRMIGAA